jgi:hypothetical protein
MTHITALVAALKTLGLVLGGLITYYSYKAFRRTGSSALRALFVGFGVVTLGALLAGIADQLLPVDATIALAVESLFTTAGFAIILYSLYAE